MTGVSNAINRPALGSNYAHMQPAEYFKPKNSIVISRLPAANFLLQI